MNYSRLMIYDLRFSAWMRPFIFIFILVTAPFYFASSAEPEQQMVRPGRYLLVFDTSSSMRRYAENTRTVVNQLLSSGMNGQLHSNDTVGIWTFNEGLYTGRFPLQLWTPENRQYIATNIAGFLQRQPYEKKSSMVSVLPQLFQLVRASEKITVVLVTGGDTKITGIPYEREINQSYEASRADMRKQRMPFVTVLRAWHGQFIGASVNWSPWPVEFPQFPPEPQLAERPKKEPAPEPESKTVPSLIVIGHPPATTIAPTSEPAATPALSNPEKATERVPVVVPNTEELAPTKNPPPETISEPVTAEPLKSESATEKSKTEIQSEPVTTPVLPEQPSPSSAAPTVAQPEIPPVQTAVALPPQTKSSRTIFLLAGAIALVAALGLAFLLMRRQHSASHASLITRSMDQDKK